MAFHLIDLEAWERRDHYRYYQTLVRTGYTLTAELDITRLLKEVRRRGLRFYPVMLYVVSTAVNRQQELRMARDKEGRLGYWDVCHPSYTIFHADDHTFSDIWTAYSPDFSRFYRDCTEDMETWKDVKGIKTKPSKPDAFTPISCLPWLSYAGISYDTPMTSPMLFPVVLFGKYAQHGDRMLMPFSGYFQHCVCDGYHASLFFNTVQELAEHPEEWMGEKG